MKKEIVLPVSNETKYIKIDCYQIHRSTVEREVNVINDKVIE